jgi:hypothetical protein
MLLDISDLTSDDLTGFFAILIIIPLAFVFGLILFFNLLDKYTKKDK